jgi:hypothetical protein
MDSSTKQASRLARREAARQARDAFPPMGVYAIRDHSSGHRPEQQVSTPVTALLTKRVVQNSMEISGVRDQWNSTVRRS